MFEKKPMQPQIPEIDLIVEMMNNNTIDANGQFPKNHIEVAQAIVKVQQQEREAIRIKRKIEQEHIAKIYNEPDSKIWRLWRNINSQPESLTEYLMSYDLNALEKFLADLKARPLHYNSLFANGQLKDAIAFIETTLEKRK